MFLRGDVFSSETLNAKKSTFQAEIGKKCGDHFCRKSNSTPTIFHQIFKILIIFRVIAKKRFEKSAHSFFFGGAVLKKWTPQNGFLTVSYSQHHALSAHCIRFVKNGPGKKSIFFGFLDKKKIKVRIFKKNKGGRPLQTLRHLLSKFEQNRSRIVALAKRERRL